MEIRQVKGIFVNVFTDSVLNLSYGKILTEKRVESLRFPAALDNYKYKHLIQPHFLLHVEIIKTRKNWIVKSILGHEELYKPETYDDYVKLSEISKILSSSVIDEESTNILYFLVTYLKNVKHINVSEFDKLLQKNLGF
jgi:hypothetical protein